MFDRLDTSVTAKPAFIAHLGPEELESLAEKQLARAMRIKTAPERLRVLTVAGALRNIAEIKRRLLKFERRLLN